MDINKLFGNSIIQNAALGTLRKAMKNHNIKAAVIVYNAEADKLEFQFYNEKPQMVSDADMQLYQDAVLKLLENGTEPAT